MVLITVERGATRQFAVGQRWKNRANATVEIIELSSDRIVCQVRVMARSHRSPPKPCVYQLMGSGYYFRGILHDLDLVSFVESGPKRVASGLQDA